MGIAYRIDKGMGATLVVWDDAITANEFLSHVQRLSSDAAWPPAGRLHLSDLRTATLDASLDERIVEQAAEFYGRQQPKIANMKVAIVAGIAFQHAVVFERVLERHGATVIVFNFLDTARKWLNLPSDEVERTFGQLRAQVKGK